MPRRKPQTNAEIEKHIADVRVGREASLVIGIAKPVLDEMVDQLIKNALLLYRGQKMSKTQAYAFVAKLDALCGFEDEMNDRIAASDRAESRHLAGQVD